MVKFVFVLKTGATTKKVAFGQTLPAAFGWRGGLPPIWQKAWKKGLVKKYTVAEYIKKGRL